MKRLLAPFAFLAIAAPISQAAEPDSTPTNADLEPGAVFRDCPTCPEMVVVPAGSYDMGSPVGEGDYLADEKPFHTVTIDAPLAVGRYEITRGEFAAFVRETGHEAAGCRFWDGEARERRYEDARDWRDPGFDQDDSHPVVCVSWHDARAYANWLSDRTGERYRLLSEAEWEYAARAGTAEARFWEVASDEACAFANVHDLTNRKAKGLPRHFHLCNDGFSRTAPVGSFEPNAFGLYDMLGNVWEWTEDCWNDNHDGAPATGAARTTGNCDYRVIRGGSWIDPPEGVRVSNRAAEGLMNRNDPIGVRLARSLD
jgi:formylglycine-generating enzyme required for sulfatase activity